MCVGLQQQDREALGGEREGVGSSAVVLFQCSAAVRLVGVKAVRWD